MPKKILYLQRKELARLIINELKKLKKVEELSEGDLKEHFRQMYWMLLDEYGVEGIVVKGIRAYNTEFIFNEDSFLWYVPKLFGKQRFQDLLGISVVGEGKAVSNRRGLSLIERLAVRFGLGRMDEVVKKCRKKDKKSSDDVWCVYSEKGRLLGKAKTKEDAMKRLRQVEYFKRKAKKGRK